MLGETSCLLQGLTDTVKRYARPRNDPYKEGMALIDVVKQVGDCSVT